ncbi:MAG: N-acetylmuramoyl-L-alanine amidase [Thermoflexibacter sp.]|jgi:hypothetical protein|nr:N-acetylmuramoyl-L-alanine amidase [Thermoflexibacter sp.]
MPNIKDYFLNQGQYLTSEFKKDKIFIHHTAGSHIPENTIHWWNSDAKNRVATAFVIGGLSTRKPYDNTKNGLICRAFEEKYWAIHLNGQELYHLDKSSIAIEICNYGHLNKLSNGKYLTYVNTEVPSEQVIKLNKPFRNSTYYHAYTDAQLEALKELLIFLSEKYKINIQKGLKEWIAKENLKVPTGLSILEQQRWLNEHGFVGEDGERLIEDGIKGMNTIWALESVGKSAFELNAQCIKGSEGLWTHTNVRKDKNDCSPQPNLIQLINSL